MFGSIMLVLAAVAQAPPADLEDALALLDRLDGMAVVAEFDQTPLSEALGEMQTRLNVPLRADWPALSRLGVSAHDEITLRIDGVSANSALAAMALCLGDELERPMFEAHAGQVVLTTIDGSVAMRLTAAYDVRDLLANEALVRRLEEQRPRPDVGDEPAAVDEDDAKDGDREPAPERPNLPVQRPPDPLGPPPGHGPRGPRIAPPPDAPPEVASHDPTPGERLIWLITDHVDPEAWMNFGGNRALVSEIDGVLMVTAPPRTHRLLRDALGQLRLANPANLTMDAMIVDLPRAAHERLSRSSDPSSAAFAVALRADKDATTVWRSQQAVAMGGELRIESGGGAGDVQMSLAPRFDESRGLLTIDVNASTTADNDRRHVQTALALNPSQSCAVVELAPSQPSDMMRLLILSVSRR